jgi:hypothetical protein
MPRGVRLGGELKRMRLLALVVTVTVLLAGCAQSGEDKFNSDVRQHGIGLSQVWTPGNNLGTVVCKDIHNSNNAANEVTGGILL